MFKDRHAWVLALVLLSAHVSVGAQKILVYTDVGMSTPEASVFLTNEDDLTLKRFITQVNEEKDVSLVIFNRLEPALTSGQPARGADERLHKLNVPYVEYLNRLSGNQATVLPGPSYGSHNPGQDHIQHDGLTVLFWDARPDPGDHQKTASWLADSLKRFVDTEVIILANEPLIPIGLSGLDQAERPAGNWQRLIDIMAAAPHLRQVILGHSKGGLKASVKSSRMINDLPFVVAPSAVKPLPFGEEFAVYEMHKDDPFRQLGYFLEIKLDKALTLIGRKVGRVHQVAYPLQFGPLSEDEKKWFFRHHLWPDKPQLTPLYGGSWDQSFRYAGDRERHISNTIEPPGNELRIEGMVGSWAEVELTESISRFVTETAHKDEFRYEIRTPHTSRAGAGGYIRHFYRQANGHDWVGLVLYWGTTELPAQALLESWLPGNRWVDTQGDWTNGQSTIRLFTHRLNFYAGYTNQSIRFNPQGLIRHLNGADVGTESTGSQVMVAHGVWSEVSQKPEGHFSELFVKRIQTTAADASERLLLALNGRRLLVGPVSTQ